jgi:hypothetical protein
MTWAKFMRVAMAYEVPKPLPGLPPPDISTEPLVADAADADGLFSPGASGRLAQETSAALNRLEERFRRAAGDAPQRQAALRPGESVTP